MKRLVSIVIPVHNEELIIEDAVLKLVAEFSSIAEDFEIIPVENGSSDRTWELILKLSEADKRIKPLRSAKPDYGFALKMGISNSKNELIISDEIDVLDHNFHKDAIQALDKFDIVIASKRHPSAKDDRGFLRLIGTETITLLLKLICGMKASDSHGPKCWRRETAQAIVKASLLDGDLFASEAVLRAERMGLKIKELPLSIKEKRKTPISLIKRIPKVIRDIYFLKKALNN